MKIDKQYMDVVSGYSVVLTPEEATQLVNWLTVVTPVNYTHISNKVLGGLREVLK